MTDGSRMAVRLEADGQWCPMAHCNRRDDSFHELAPLAQPRSLERIGDARVSPFGFIHLGAFTGTRMAVCTYASPRLPAIAAFDYDEGRTLWVSPLEDLQGLPRRIPAGILIARVTVPDAHATTCVFAANPSEFVAYGADGTRLWKRGTREITPSAPAGLGIPISMSYTDAGEVVAATSKGWVVKLHPLSGATIAAYRMRTSVAIGGRLYRGTFGTMKSPVVVGDAMYVLAEFHPDRLNRPRWVRRPVYLLRITLARGQGRRRDASIVPLAEPRTIGEVCADRAFAGITQGRGSPPALVTREGRVMVFAHAHEEAEGRVWPTMAGISDEGGRLTRQWTARLPVVRGDSVHSAPALHARTRTLLVTTYSRMFAFRDVDTLQGELPRPEGLRVDALFAPASTPGVERVAFGSPFALTEDRDTGDVVAYTNFRAFSGGLPYGFLGAFVLPRRRTRTPRPLWARPLNFTAQGQVVSSPGTFGQPALFEYDGRRGRATGLIVNTVYTGTYMIK